MRRELIGILKAHLSRNVAKYTAFSFFDNNNNVKCDNKKTIFLQFLHTFDSVESFLHSQSQK